MRTVSGTFNGVGSAISIGIGFIPDWVKVLNVESASTEDIMWSRHMRSLECLEGVQHTGADGTTDELAFGEGIAPYRGQDYPLTAASTTLLVPVKIRDQRAANTSAAVLSDWTLGSAANRTGSWNAECSTTRIGEGSVIRIRETATGLIKEAVITALTSNGEQANEVTISEAVKSGTILFVGPMYDYEGGAIGDTIPQGFTINETANINVSGEMCMFEAGCYNN